MSRTSLAAALLCVAACGSKSSTTESGGGPPAKRTGDASAALWALAPDKLVGGFVVTPAALAQVDPILDRARKLAVDPELALLNVPLDQITAVMGRPDAHLADAGIAADKGFAFFQTEDNVMYAILPMGDRDKLVKTLHGQRGMKDGEADTVNTMQCNVVGGNYVCTKTGDIAKADRLGKGKGLVDADFATLGARGDIEGWAGKMLTGRGGFDSAVVAVSMEHGQLVVDARGNGKAAQLASLVSAERAKPDTDGAAGFFVVALAPFLANLPTDIPLIPIAELAKTVKGTMYGTLPAGGGLDFNFRIPLTDGAMFTTLIAQCDALLPPKYHAAQQQPGACRIVVPTAAVPFEFDVWVENNELRLAGSKTAKPHAKLDVLTATAKEFMTGDWTYAIWGRGSIVAEGGMPFAMPQGSVPAEGLLAVRGLTALSEVGLGVKVDDTGIKAHVAVRTIWANPADVADKLSAISAAEIIANTAVPKFKAIADAAPQSLFATDFKSGQSGMMAPGVAGGVIAAVAIPAFLDYGKKAKRPEAALQLNKLGKNAKVLFATDGAFAVGDVPLDPAESCCKAPTGKCTSKFDNPIWNKLDFAVDEPHLFRYSYTGTATEFTAKAVGDLDCDGIEITYTLSGKVENGNAVVNLESPPPNSD